MIKLILFLLFLLPIRSVFSQGVDSPESLSRAISQLVSGEIYDNAIWAVRVIDLNTNEVLYTQNERLSLLPASNAKLYTTAALLDQLGPTYRYETPLFTAGPVITGSLRGPVIVRGSGDPSMGGRYAEKDADPLEAMRTWARALREQGIRVIDGDLIGDDDLFDDLTLGLGWSWDDEPYYYSAEISALTFYDNSIRFIMEGQSLGQPARLRWEPLNTAYVDVANRTVSVHSAAKMDEEFMRPRNFNSISVSGEIPDGKIDTTYISVSNPTQYFMHVFRDVLIEEGIAVTGRPMDVDDLAIKPSYDDGRYRQRAVHQSPPLTHIVEVINKESQNLYAELLIRTLGVRFPIQHRDIEPGSAEMGVEAAKNTYVKARIDTSRIQLVDGSGLSRMNLVTAEMTANLLQYMWSHPYATIRQAFYRSLPIGGVDGTLEDRFNRGPAYRNVRAKTGTLTGASSLSGYVTSAAGTPLLFVLMVNNFTEKNSVVRRTQDDIVNLLASYRK